MADAGKVMFLGLRKMAIEKELEKAEEVVEILELSTPLWTVDKIPKYLEVLDEWQKKVAELKESVAEAEQEWIAAGEEYKRARA